MTEAEQELLTELGYGRSTWAVGVQGWHGIGAPAGLSGIGRDVT